MEKWTSSTSGMTEHLEPEVLASFLDGQLPEDENRRVRQHLAECEDCNQVFVVTGDFLREEEEQRKADEQRNVLPFDKPDSREDGGSWRWRFAVAATVVLAVGAGGLGYRAFEAPGMATPSVPVSPPAVPDANRAGAGELPDEQAALTLGAQRMALASGVARGADTSKVMEGMASVVNRTPSLRQLRVDPNEPNAADRLLKADLRGKLDAPQWFDLGELAAWGKAAAHARQENLLRGSLDGFRFGRTLSRLQREKASPLNPWPDNQLSKIEHLLDAPKLDFPALKKAFEEILVSADPAAFLSAPL